MMNTTKDIIIPTFLHTPTPNFLSTAKLGNMQSYLKLVPMLKNVRQQSASHILFNPPLSGFRIFLHEDNRRRLNESRTNAINIFAF
mmetsp:Transcript_11388/g.17102  ORF Transcript_11388/g.17102 Transcript_11388/m.17102 type:complete len:86 (+) Transcript_11388:303-560(+)